MALVKIVLLGDVGVGKTTMIQNYVNPEKKDQTAPTMNNVMFNRNENINGIQTKLSIWDTAGQEKFESLGVAFYRSSNACIIAFDVTKKASFEALGKWKKNFLDNAAPRNPETFPIIVVGNKIDLNAERVVMREEAESWCNANGNMPYYETCATEGTGLTDVFMKCGTQGVKDAKVSSGGADDDMPTSLSGAAGAIKLDPKQEEEIRQSMVEKKKKKCKC